MLAVRLFLLVAGGYSGRRVDSRSGGSESIGLTFLLRTRAQAEPLADMQTLEQYTDWMKGMLVVLPDASYDVKSFATDQERNNVCACAVFSGTHTGEGGPVPPTGKSTSTDYVYVMEFEDGKISHMTKIWNAGWAMRELGWTG